MTNKTFFTLLLLGISYTAYNAVAVSENFEISTTIDHEITLGGFRSLSEDGAGLDVKGNINLGTIYINPTYTQSDTYWNYSDQGIISYPPQKAIVRADNQTVGLFAADIPDPSACNNQASACGGLEVIGSYVNSVSFFGGGDSWCHAYIKYSGESNLFKLFLSYCHIGYPSVITTGVKKGTLTITYTPG
ncbi:MAG: hypothetical protein IJ689_07650 [Alphaproteobacteria bacterium]|nr:hypothetical protein [Alphaproteobacteria bacterium]